MISCMDAYMWYYSNHDLLQLRFIACFGLLKASRVYVRYFSCVYASPTLVADSRRDSIPTYFRKRGVTLSLYIEVFAGSCVDKALQLHCPIKMVVVATLFIISLMASENISFEENTKGNRAIKTIKVCFCVQDFSYTHTLFLSSHMIICLY